jgi:phosphatidyl-myo-inositol dimannoside synthase
MILFASQNFLPDVGGTQLYVTGLADALAARGHTLEVYCDASSAGAAHVIDTARNYPIRRFGGFRPLLRWRKARAVSERLGQGGVDALVTDTWKSLEQIPAEALAGVRVFCLGHGSEFLQMPRSLKERRMRACLAKADIVAANSRFTADLVRPHVSDKTKVEVIWPGVVPPAGAAPQFSERPANNAPKLITIARLEPRKGVDAVLRALPALRAKFPQIAYDIVGKGEDRNRLIELSQALRVSDCVRFHGYISDDEKAALLSAADLFLLPNRREPGSVEGFGIVFLEAAAFGVPSLAGADGGTADAVVDGETGAIVDGASDAAVEAALMGLLSDPARRGAMGRAAHGRFWTSFAWEKAVARFEAALSDKMPR